MVGAHLLVRCIMRQCYLRCSGRAQRGVRLCERQRAGRGRRFPCCILVAHYCYWLSWLARNICGMVQSNGLPERLVIKACQMVIELAQLAAVAHHVNIVDCCCN